MIKIMNIKPSMTSSVPVLRTIVKSITSQVLVVYKTDITWTCKPIANLWRKNNIHLQVATLLNGLLYNFKNLAGIVQRVEFLIIQIQVNHSNKLATSTLYRFIVKQCRNAKLDFYWKCILLIALLLFNHWKFLKENQWRKEKEQRETIMQVQMARGFSDVRGRFSFKWCSHFRACPLELDQK